MALRMLENATSCSVNLETTNLVIFLCEAKRTISLEYLSEMSFYVRIREKIEKFIETLFQRNNFEFKGKNNQ